MTISSSSPNDVARLRDEIETTIDAGFTLPAWWYTDERVAAIERDLIFRRTWQVAGLSESLTEPGSYMTAQVADVPVLVVRQQDGSLKGFVNVCRHRGHEVAQGCGVAQVLQCAYHGWTYRLDGQLVGVPRADEEPNFDKASLPLLEVGVAAWGPFVFVNLDPDANSFESTFGEMIEGAEARGMGLAGTSVAHTTEWVFDCNWKIFIDNSADCYHCPIVHRSFAKTHGVTNDRYVLSYTDHYDHHLSPAREAGGMDWEMYTAWPAWQISATPSELRRVRSLTPIGAEQVKVSTYFAGTPADFEAGIAEIIERETGYNDLIVGDEDRSVCESVQRGLKAGAVVNGPLLLESEWAVIAFQQRLQSALAAKPVSVTVPA
jgi:phenylpropionate dioxygenase-like ring-hydroxylating dioxygenase large terminal subunit